MAFSAVALQMVQVLQLHHLLHQIVFAAVKINCHDLAHEQVGQAKNILQNAIADGEKASSSHCHQNVFVVGLLIGKFEEDNEGGNELEGGQDGEPDKWGVKQERDNEDDIEFEYAKYLGKVLDPKY